MEKLDRKAQLNVEWDILARLYAHASWCRNCRVPILLLHESVAIWVKGQKEMSHVGPMVRAERSR